MYISQMKLQNFRCYDGIHTIFFSKGINYLVGENNCGKTTIFRALEFLISGRTKEEWISKTPTTNDVSVEVILSGDDLPTLLENSELKKYQPYLYEDNDTFNLNLRRSSKVTKWKSRGKEKEITIRNIAMHNVNTGMYENPTGVDSVITALFEPQFVYSDLNNEEYRDFSKTKIVGKLINEVIEISRQSEAWRKLERSHRAVFGEAGLARDLHELEETIQEFMLDQYGDVRVQFDFKLPVIESFLKNGQILLEDNGIMTDVADKGTGMQRALAMSLIQVYARNIKEKKNADKSLLFFLDEPETFLHPRAQDRLLQSLENLSLYSQIFITTHSPYLLKNYSNKHSLKLFSRKEGKIQIKEQDKISLLYDRPTWGEINYWAFGVVSEEFHIDLFGRVHEIVRKNFGKDFKSIAGFDDWLAMQKAVPVTLTDENHQNHNGDRLDKTMSCYIRNCIDHPGNHDIEEFHRPKPERDEIRRSIEEMLTIYKALSSTIKMRQLKNQFAEYMLPKLYVNKSQNRDVCAVLHLSSEPDAFKDALEHLIEYGFRGSMETISEEGEGQAAVALAKTLKESVNPSTHYFLYLDQPSGMKELPQNHYILVNKEEKPSKHAKCVLEYQGKIYIRLYIPQNDTVLLRATNQDSESFTCLKEEVHCLGIVKSLEKRKLTMWRPSFQASPAGPSDT